MPGAVVCLLALMVVVVESVFLEAFSVQIWALQSPIMIVAYLSLDREFTVGAAVLVVLMLPVEWLVAGVDGVYSLGLVAVYLALRLVGPNLQNDWGLVRGGVAAVAALIHGAVILAVLYLLGHGETPLWSTVVTQFFWTAPVVAVGTVVLGKGFARLDEMMDPRKGRSELEI